MEKDNVDISVVIPVKNGMGTLQACLDGIFSQTVKERMEVVIIDSGSTDGSLELLEKYPAKVFHLNPKDFNHGETRNLGVSLSKGKFVLMTVQDAWAASNDWMELMLSHFDDPQVAGVCGQQIVPEDRSKNPLQWFRPAEEAQPFSYQFEDPDEFREMSGKQQHAYCMWDDVNAMYRKDIKEELPFRKMMFSEDTLWAKDALEKGHKIVYDYRARVYHYHHQNFRFYFKRSYIILYQNYKFYDYIKFPKNPFVRTLQIKYRLMQMKELSIGEKIKWIHYNMKLVLASWCASLIFAFNARFRGMKGVESSQKFFVGYPPQGVQKSEK